MIKAEEYRKFLLELAQVGVQPEDFARWLQLARDMLRESQRYTKQLSANMSEIANLPFVPQLHIAIEPRIILAAQMRIFELEQQVARYVEAGCDEILAVGDRLAKEQDAEELKALLDERIRAQRRSHLRLVSDDDEG